MEPRVPATKVLLIRLCPIAVVMCFAGSWAFGEPPEGQGGHLRLAQPRVPPLTAAEAGETGRALLQSLERNGRVINVYGTFARHPGLRRGFSGFGGYIMANSTLPARDRELLILRIGWLCQAEYEWSRHALIARRSGVGAEELHRIAEGPMAEGWSAFDSALLRCADELHRDGMVSDTTWMALSKRYSTRQLMDAVLTVGEYNLISMVLNSLGVQFDEGAPDRFPEDVPLPRAATDVKPERLNEPRIVPLARAEWDDETRELLSALEEEGLVGNLLATGARHPRLSKPLLDFMRYLKRDSSLPPRDREILILRTAWQCRAAYAWGHHAQIGKEIGLGGEAIERIALGPAAAGWAAFDRALLRAADELVLDAFISDTTWKALAERYTTHQLMDAVFTVGGYKLLAMALNSFGVQLEEGIAGFPE